MISKISRKFKTRRKKKTTSFNKRESIAAYIFLTPNIIGFLAFTAIPVVFSLVLSFFSWDLVSTPKFVGLANYLKLFEDTIFKQSSLNTIYYVAVYVPLNIVISLVLAMWVCELTKGSGLLQTIFFLPVLAPTVAMSLVWKFMFDPQGIVNNFLSIFGVEPLNWLGNPKYAMLGIIFMSVWKQFGYNMIVFISGIKNIPKTIYEAADIDGVNGWQRFWKITLPLLSPSMLFAVIMTIISSFQVFDQAMIMTKGGPLGATNTLVMYIYQNGFQFYKMGYASAIAWILFAIIFVVTLIQMRLQEKWNY